MDVITTYLKSVNLVDCTMALLLYFLCGSIGYHKMMDDNVEY